MSQVRAITRRFRENLVSGSAPPAQPPAVAVAALCLLTYYNITVRRLGGIYAINTEILTEAQVFLNNRNLFQWNSNTYVYVPCQF